MTGRTDAEWEPARELAEFIAGVAYRDLPDPVVELVERCFLDTAGVVLAGVTEGAGRIAAELEGGGQATGSARVLGRGDQLPETAAAFTNATAGHVHDFDDYTQSMIGHPSVVLVPAILAVGEAENLSGQDAITAYVTGFEAMCHLGTPRIERFYRAGWFSTTLFGTIGATAAVVRLLGLEADQARTALNLSAALAAGLLRHNGTMAKPIQVGQAARSAVTAARYAAADTTAADVLTGEGGFYDLHIDEAYPDVGVSLPPDRWALLTEGVHLKKYPCCSDAHTAIAATAAIMAGHDIAPETIESVTVTASERARQVLRYDNPETGTEAMFSMPYVVACMIVRGRVDIPAFRDRNVKDSTVQGVRESVAFTVDPSLTYTALQARVKIDTGGEAIEHTVTRPPGHPENPLRNEELREKFVDCARYSLGDGSVEAAYERLESLRDTDIRPIVDALTGAR